VTLVLASPSWNEFVRVGCRTAIDTGELPVRIAAVADALIVVVVIPSIPMNVDFTGRLIRTLIAAGVKSDDKFPTPEIEDG